MGFDRDDEVIDMVNGKKNNDDNVFIDMVNERAAKIEQELENRKKFEQDFAATERAIQHSIAREDSKIEFNNYLQERAKQLKRQRLIKLAAVIIATTIAIGGSIYAAGRIDDQIDISRATSYAMSNARDDLITLVVNRIGSFTYSSEDDVGQMVTFLNTDDYSTLDINGIEDVYAFKRLLPPKEFEQLIRSMKYTTPDGTFNYTSFEQYLNINGYPGEREFVNRAQAILLESYRDGSLVCYRDISKNKGGRN